MSYIHTRKQTPFVLLLLLIMLCACSEKEYTGNDPNDAFAYARKSYDKENYETALKHLGEFKSRFPYSKHISLANLFIANSHFQLDQYEEAALTYTNFIKLHPKHEQVPFSMYRIGESYWSLAPEEVQRDQEFTKKALTEWDRLIQRFPEDQYTNKAQKLVKIGKRRLAENYAFIAKFYCKAKIYHSCVYRSLLLLESFPDFKDLHEEARLNASKSLEILAKEKEIAPQSDTNIYHKTMTPSEMRAKADSLKKVTAEK